MFVAEGIGSSIMGVGVWRGLCSFIQDFRLVLNLGSAGISLISLGRQFHQVVDPNLYDCLVRSILPILVEAEKSGSKLILELSIAGVFVHKSFHITVRECIFTSYVTVTTYILSSGWKFWFCAANLLQFCRFCLAVPAVSSDRRLGHHPRL